MPVLHPIPPVYDAACTTLILGSFPSVRSRETAFFYGHPQNRFWRVLAAVYREPVARTKEEKISQLLRHHLALWDVAAACEITGSSDASIREITPVDLSPLLAVCPIRRVFTNGGTAHKLYVRYLQNSTGIQDIPLPSTSAANARCSLEALADQWQILRDF